MHIMHTYSQRTDRKLDHQDHQDRQFLRKISCKRDAAFNSYKNQRHRSKTRPFRFSWRSKMCIAILPHSKNETMVARTTPSPIWNCGESLLRKMLELTIPDRLPNPTTTPIVTPRLYIPSVLFDTHVRVF